MKVMKKTLLMVVLLLAVCGCLSISKQVSAKTVSKVTKVFTLTPKKNFIRHKLSIKKKVKVVAKMKFLEVKGKVSLKSGEELYLGEYDCYDGKGSFFSSWSKPDKLKKKSFKKGKVLVSNEDYISGKSIVEWYIPKGIKKLKVQVTYYTKNGKAAITR